MKFGAFLCLIFFGATYCAQYSLEKCESENLCATDYKPICASSGKVQKSFSNDCQLNVFNKCNKMLFKKKYNGECKENKKLKCDFGCSFHYDPVCAIKGNDQKAFLNECQLMRENCENPENVYQITSKSECGIPEGQKCEHYCPLDYDPLCGFNGLTHRTFTNKCYLERFNCLEDEVFVHRFNGTCWNPEINCDIICTQNYSPVCAYDGILHRTFANECLLNAYNCPRNFFNMKKKFDGECGQYEGQRCNEKNCGHENHV